MKKILCLLILSSCAAYAADSVEVVSSVQVNVNGVNAGKPADTIKNRPELTSEIQRALEKYEAALVAVIRSQAAEIEKLKADLDKVKKTP
jgi:hypothetical protein